MRSRLIPPRLGVLFAILAGSLWFGCRDKPALVPTSTLTLTSAPILPPVATGTPVPAPGWRGITPGKTTRAQVLQVLGAPNTVKTWEDLEVFRYYHVDDPRHFPLVHDKVVLHDGIVQMLLIHVENEADFPPLDLHRAEKEVVYGGSPNLDKGFLYPQWGILVLANQATIDGPYTWSYVQFFVPMSLPQYMATWGQYYPRDDPFPIKFPGRPDQMGIIPGRTTRGDILDLYGQPDYTVKGSFPWDSHKLVEHCIYYLPRTFADLYDFYFEDDVVVAVEIDLQTGEYTLGEAIDKYGMPEIVLRKYTGFRQYMWAFCFPEAGGVLRVPGISRSTQLPSQRSDMVSWMCVFPPMSVEEFLRTWGKAFADTDSGWERVEWKGLANR